jgi:calcineurin-like phosphoesterase
VIGIRTEDAIPKFLTQMPRRFTVADGPALLSAVLVETEASGRATRIERIQIHEE